MGGDIASALTVSYDNSAKKISIKGKLTGLPAKVTNAGIHVHEGKDCDDMNAIGGHLYTNTLDSWAFPDPVTYSTNAQGEATVIAKAKGHVLSKADAKDGKVAVEDHCIVLHGVSVQNMGARVATGKIVKEGSSFIAKIGKYPGPPSGLATTPSGTLTLTTDGDNIIITGNLKGLGRDLKGAGIHIHTGTDCTGGTDQSSIDAVNEVIGGHLLSRGDGFLNTFYSSTQVAKGTIDISTPKGSYVLREADTSGPASVENRCIVIPNAQKSSWGVGKIKCTTDTVCTAEMKPYPTARQAEVTTVTMRTTSSRLRGSTTTSTTTDSKAPASTTEATKSTTSKDKVSGAVNVLISISSLVAYCIAVL